MSKRIEIDGKFYRKRRGVLVEIPSEWVGRTVTSKVINRRQSKHIRKLRMTERKEPNWKTLPEGASWKSHGMHPRNLAPRHRGEYAPKIKDED